MDRGKHICHHLIINQQQCVCNSILLPHSKNQPPYEQPCSSKHAKNTLTCSHTVAVLLHLLTDLIPHQRHVLLQPIQLHPLLLHLLLIAPEPPLQLCKNNLIQSELQKNEARMQLGVGHLAQGL